VGIAVPPALESEGFNGTFEHDQPLGQILNTLATTLDASVQGSAGEGYRLVSAGRR
jgi:hypothetical protein